MLADKFYSRDNLRNKTTDGTYVINLDQYSDIGTGWIAFNKLNSNLLILIVLELKTFQKNAKIYW